MRFDYKKFSDHNWIITYDDDLSFQCICDNCKYKVTLTCTIDDSIRLGFISDSSGHHHKQYGNSFFFPDFEKMNDFFETYSCSDLIIKDIIE